MDWALPGARLVPAAATAVRVALGAAFLWAGTVKAMDPAGSVSDVAAYRVLPTWAEEAVGLSLPWVEVGLGTLLVLGAWVRPVAGLTLLLLAVFLAGMVSARARGLDIPCGCFGVGSGRIGAVELARDVGLMALAGFVLWKGNRSWGLDRWTGR